MLTESNYIKNKTSFYIGWFLIIGGSVNVLLFAIQSIIGFGELTANQFYAILGAWFVGCLLMFYMGNEFIRKGVYDLRPKYGSES